VIEHKPATITIAGHVVDLGPGTAGGELVFEGTVDRLRASGTLTGRHLNDRASPKPSVRTPVSVRAAGCHGVAQRATHRLNGRPAARQEAASPTHEWQADRE